MGATWRRRFGTACVAVLAIASLNVVTAPQAAAADARPFFQMPTYCGGRWSAVRSSQNYDIQLRRAVGSTVGQGVYASGPGVVHNLLGAGGRSWVRIKHNDDWATFYRNLDESTIKVRGGQRVVQGQYLGNVSNYAGSTSPHLEYAQLSWTGHDWQDATIYFNGVRSATTERPGGPPEYLTSNNCGARVVSGGYGYLYRILPNGTLVGYRHRGWLDGTNEWNEWGTVGSDWENFVHIVADNNRIYGIDYQGKMRWYSRNEALGSWDPDSNSVVGVGWYFKQVISGGGGVFYAITESGELKWYKRTSPGTGDVGWHTRSGTTIGTGWNNFQLVTSISGTIYAVDENFNLYWYRFPGYLDGVGGWSEGSGRRIGTDWGFSAIGAGGDGTIYATAFNGDLYWYDHRDPTGGTSEWADRKRIGTGWM